MGFTNEQFKEWVNEAFPDNVARAIAERDFRDGLNKMADYVFDTNSATFIQQSIEQVQIIKNATVLNAGYAKTDREQAALILTATSQERLLAQNAKIAAESARDQAADQYEDKGVYDALNNLPALTADAAIGQSGTKKQRYVVTVAGPAGFAGYNFTAGTALNIDDKIYQFSNGQWYLVPHTTLALQKVINLEQTTSGISNEYPGEFIIIDENGFIGYRSNATGANFPGKVEQSVIATMATDLTSLTNRTASLEAATEVLATFSDLFPGQISIVDNNGYEAFRTSTSGVDFIGKSAGGSSTAPKQPAVLVSDYAQFIIYGQSLSVSGNFSMPIDLYDTKTFQGGILTNYDPDIAGAADTYFGSALISLPSTGTETQGKGLAKILKELIRDENGIAIADQNFTPIINSAGTSGASWTVLSNTAGDEYRRLLESVRRGKDFALAVGKTYNVPILCYIQGEATSDRNGTVTEWYTKLETLFNSLNTDIKAITNQVNDVQFVIYQIASGITSEAFLGVPMAQLKIAREKPNVHFGCAMYQVEYVDALHVTSDAYRVMGAMMGVVSKRAIVDGKKMEPIYIISQNKQKNESGSVWVVSLKMNVPSGPLVFDETINSLFTTPPTNKGFKLKNSSGVDIITNVTISHGDTINIFCNQNPTGLNLTYATGGKSSGGNLRDSQGDKVKISCSGVNKRVDNWCPIFDQIIL